MEALLNIVLIEIGDKMLKVIAFSKQTLKLFFGLANSQKEICMKFIWPIRYS